jgi:hypothetical protein
MALQDQLCHSEVNLKEFLDDTKEMMEIIDGAENLISLHEPYMSWTQKGIDIHRF